MPAEHLDGIPILKEDFTPGTGRAYMRFAQAAVKSAVVSTSLQGLSVLSTAAWANLM